MKKNNRTIDEIESDEKTKLDPQVEFRIVIIRIRIDLVDKARNQIKHCRQPQENRKSRKIITK